ncbi:hypothetical protein [Vibrio cholerae]|uniref:hypothetical protein n=1 Tax=Vibrio cholerae TaxID=666 RepID=UPI001664D3E7|nr:hypothetical protein [Vibrio cholerae]GFK70565.1 hypothetical protein VcPa11_03296 [Vibrio cholerae]GFK77653.1 hypothetical protein VcPa13_03297 [Vibrio cholerae]
MKKINEIIKSVVLMSTIFGVYFFFVFTVSERIPLPLDIDGLPSLLITMGLLGFSFSIIAFIYIFMAAILTFSGNEVDIYKSFYQNSFLIKNKHISSVVGFFIYFSLTPIALWSGYFFDFGTCLALFWGISIPFLYSFYILTPNQSLIKCDFRVLFTSKYIYLVFNYYFIILLFYYFIILLFYYFIILLFYYFIILLFYYFIILLFYCFIFQYVIFNLY